MVKRYLSRVALIFPGVLLPFVLLELVVRGSPDLSREVHAACERAGHDLRFADGEFEPPPGTRPLVAVVGESTAEAVSTELFRSLDRQARVWNCGVSAISPEIVARRVDRVLRFRPDTVVIVVGHNFRFQHRVNEGARRLWSVARGSLATSLLASRALPSAMVSRRDGPTASRLRDLRGTLDTMVARSLASGAHVVMTTMVSNYEFPSFCGPSGERSAGAQAAARRVRMLASLGRVAQLEALGASLREELGDDMAPVDFELGIAMTAIPARARDHLTRSLERDRFAGRATPEVNETIREIARRRGTALRDAAAAYAGRSPTGLPGWDANRDNCHLRPENMRHEAEAIAALVRRAWQGERAPVDDRPPPPDSPRDAAENQVVQALRPVLARDEIVGHLAIREIPVRAAEVAIASIVRSAGLAGLRALQRGLDVANGAPQEGRVRATSVLAVAGAETACCDRVIPLLDPLEREAGSDAYIWERVFRARARCQGPEAARRVLEAWRRACPLDPPPMGPGEL